jgi:single-strand DNA-binding protein
MSNLTPLTVVGNLTADPELRFTAQGIAVVVFTVAVNPRTYDKTTEQWKDGEPAFHRCTAWRQLAENTADCLRKGDRVIVTGNLTQRHWVDEKTQEKRNGWQVNADAIGPDLTYATAKPSKSAKHTDVAPDDPWNSATAERPA